MASRFSDRAIVQLGGQVQYSAVDPGQRWLVSYMRRHPGATLAEARASRQPAKLTKDEIAELAAHTAWDDLTPAQRKIIRGIPHRKLTDNDVAHHSGIRAADLRYRMVNRKSGGVDPSSLEYRASRGFFGRTQKGRRLVILYVVRSPDDYDDFTFAFGTPAGIQKAIREHMPCPSPPCEDEADATVEIPLMDGYVRDNLPDEESEIAGE